MIRHLVLAAFVATTAHAEQSKDYASGVPLAPGSAKPFQKVEVPAAIYEGTARPGLADVRVFNADGELVPFAWVPPPAAIRERPPAVDLPPFPLFVDRERRDVAGLALSVVRNAAGTAVDIRSTDTPPPSRQELGGYVLDASEVRAPLNVLVFTLGPAAEVPTMHLRIDASDDLASWRSVAPDATLVNLEHDGRRLVRNRVEIPPTLAKYLRLSWTVGQPIIEFSGVRGEFAERVVEAPREWREAAGAAIADHEGEFEYDLGGAFPVDRIDVTLTEANSIVPAEILARANATDPWLPIASTVFYRLREPGEDVTNAPVPVGGAERRYWLLRFDPRAGASTRLAPQLRAGWQPAELVFATRGTSPFTLAYGNRSAKSGALPIATLLPGYENTQGLPTNVGIAHAGPKITLGGPDRLREPPDVKRWMLWGVLALGAIMLGWMAWRLSREMGATPEPGNARSETHLPPDPLR